MSGADRRTGAASVSVVIPAYNAERYIEQTVASALAQTVLPEEILVVDDGSADRTAERVQAFDAPVRLIVLQNGGVSRARNHAAQLARGEWLAFLDADDVWAPEKLEQQLLAQASAHGGRADLVYTDRRNIGVLDGLPEVQSQIQPLVEGDVFAALLTENVITTSTVMVRRSLFLELGGFDGKYQPAEDWEFWLRCAERTPFAAVRQPLVHYRLHASGESRNSARMNRAREMIVTEALARGRGSALPLATRSAALVSLWRTNGWDAARAGEKQAAVRAYARALRLAPFDSLSWKGLALAVSRR